MTDIKNHVVSLEISKQLKEAGWKKETEFWWSREYEQDKYELTRSYSRFQSADPLPHLSAPLSTEILEELPRTGDIKITTYPSGYRVFYDVKSGYGVSEESFPDTLSKMWIYLKKEGLI
jgi:hypothetical protein